MESTTEEYFYLTETEDHVDLQDLFGGEFVREKEKWKLPLREKENVLNFLNCSSSDDECATKDVRKKRKTRLHRSNSFIASSDDESDVRSSSSSTNESVSSTDENYRRRRKRRIVKCFKH